MSLSFPTKTEKVNVRTTANQTKIKVVVYAVTESRARDKARFEASDVVVIRDQTIDSVEKIEELSVLEIQPFRSTVNSFIQNRIDNQAWRPDFVLERMEEFGIDADIPENIGKYKVVITADPFLAIRTQEIESKELDRDNPEQVAVQLEEDTFLSERESQVVAYDIAGFSRPEIADKLGIEKPTVDEYFRRVGQKLDRSRITVNALYDEYED